MIAIYSITSPSGGIYIGRSKDVDRRFRHYREGRIRTQRKLMYSLKKYGWENHIFRIEEEHFEPFDFVFTSRREIEFIAAYKSVGANLLNLTDGGEGAHGVVFSPERKEQCRKAALLRPPMSESTRRKIGNINRGKKFSAEHRRKISESNKLHPNGWLGRKKSEESKIKVSLALKGRVFTDEHKANLRAALRPSPLVQHPKPMSDETKQRIREARMRYLANKKMSDPKHTAFQ